MRNHTRICGVCSCSDITEKIRWSNCFKCHPRLHTVCSMNSWEVTKTKIWNTHIWDVNVFSPLTLFESLWRKTLYFHIKLIPLQKIRILTENGNTCNFANCAVALYPYYQIMNVFIFSSTKAMPLNKHLTLFDTAQTFAVCQKFTE